MDQTGVTVFTGSEDSGMEGPGRRSGSQAALLLRHYKLFGGRGSPECSQCLGRNNHCGQLTRSHAQPSSLHGASMSWLRRRLRTLWASEKCTWRFLTSGLFQDPVEPRPT